MGHFPRSERELGPTALLTCSSKACGLTPRLNHSNFAVQRFFSSQRRSHVFIKIAGTSDAISLQFFVAEVSVCNCREFKLLARWKDKSDHIRAAWLQKLEQFAV